MQQNIIIFLKKIKSKFPNISVTSKALTLLFLNSRLPRPLNSNLGPDLQPRLPNFKNVDILRATEVLRSRDQNKNIFVNPGSVNAGILPLAFENPSNLGLFPPLLNP